MGLKNGSSVPINVLDSRYVKSGTFRPDSGWFRLRQAWDGTLSPGPQRLHP